MSTHGYGKPQPLLLLSLDGGGVRGLSTIMILDHLMRLVSRSLGRRVEPWEIFDMMGGTSTGGHEELIHEARNTATFIEG
ncbi:hypothetical protein B0J14DRAFT_595473 [Halenospora varia]|nr:hypothetical protein B0J14DRAFT_595473 [Halenospora varia]